MILAAAIIWGTTGTAQAFSSSAANPLVIGALRMAIGGTLLFFIAALNGAFKNIATVSIRGILMASVCMALYQPLFFLGVSKICFEIY